MKFLKIQRGLVPWLLFLWTIIFPRYAIAAIDNVGVLNTVLDKFEEVAGTWKTVMVVRATWLFWLLATISMVWTFGMMALRKADIGEFFAEFIRFTMFTGFFWWLLLNGPGFAIDVMKSLRRIGAEASGLPNDLGPSGIVDVGFDIFFKVVDLSNLWKPIDSLFGLLLSVCILVVFALVGTNMLLLLVSGYLFAYAGVFILGFGGAKWTSEMAINYYRSILNIALQLMAMVLIIGIGRSFIDQYYVGMDAGMKTKELGVIAVVAAVLLFMVAKIPPQIGALAGGSTGNLGASFGVGAAIGAATFGVAAASSAGAALLAGTTSAAGGAQALLAAYSRAATDVGASSAANAAGSPIASSVPGEEKGGKADTFAQAMGDAPGMTSPALRDPSSQSSRTASEDSGVDSAEERPTRPSGSASDTHSSSGKTDRTKARPSDSSQSMTSTAAASAFAVKVGKISAGTAVHLTQGMLDVATEKSNDMKAAAMDSISQTIGGKIASAVNARATASKSSETATFGDDSLSAGTPVRDAESEVAAFRNRKPESE